METVPSLQTMRARWLPLVLLLGLATLGPWVLGSLGPAPGTGAVTDAPAPAERQPDAVAELEAPFAFEGDEAAPGLERVELASAGATPSAVSEPASELVVRVRWRDGDPAVGVLVHVGRRAAAQRDPSAALARWSRATDLQGIARFREVEPGRWQFLAETPDGSARVHGGARVRPGGVQHVELTLSRVDVAAAGQVLDAAGRPLPGVRVGCFRGGRVELSLDRGLARDVDLEATDAEGRFAFVGHRREAAVLVPGLDADDAGIYEPARIEAPYGVEGFVIRRVGELERVRVLLRVRDAAEGAPLLAELELEHDLPRPAARRLDVLGELAFDAVRAPVARWTVSARGYRERRGALEGWIALGGAAVDVALERGFEREYRVVDSATGEPVEGARFSAAGETLATTDREGRAVVRAAEPPVELRVEAHGRFGVSWAPHGPGDTHLVALDADATRGR